MREPFIDDPTEHPQARPAGILLVLLLLLLSATTSSCRVTRAARDVIKPKEEKAPKISEQDLRLRLEIAAVQIAQLVEDAADRVFDQCADDRNLQKKALEWKIDLVPTVYMSLYHVDPKVSFLRLWILTTYLHLSVTEGKAKDAFGDFQPVAIEAAANALKAVRDIGSSFIPAARLDEAQQDVREFILDNPIAGISSGEGTNLFRDVESSFGWLVRIPLSPFRAAEGIGEGSAAIREAVVSANRAIRIVEELPSLVRWNAELLLLHAEENPSIATTIAAIDRFSKSSASLAETAEGLGATAERIAETAEGLPDAVGRELRSTVESTEPQLESLQTSIEEARALASDIRALNADAAATVEAARPLAETIESITANVDAGGVAWEKALLAFDRVVTSLSPAPEEASADEGSTGADTTAPDDAGSTPDTEGVVAEGTGGEGDEESENALELYRQAAEQTALAGENLDRALNTFGDVVTGDAVAERIEEVQASTISTLETTGGLTEDLIDRLVRGLLLVVGAAFLAALAYRFVAPRIPQPKGRDRSGAESERPARNP